MLECGTASQVVLARKGFCWPVPTPVWLLCLPSCVLCALSSPQSLLHTRTELRCDARVEAGPGCADLSRSPGLPWRCLPATPHQLHAHFTAGIFGMVLFHYFLDFPLVRLAFLGWGGAAAAASSVGFGEFLTHRKVPAAQDMHTLKCVFMNLKWQTFFAWVFYFWILFSFPK